MAKRLLPILLFLVACPPAPESDCANQLDDDGDGLLDCNDPDCDGETVCGEDTSVDDTGDPPADGDGDGYPAGEDCDDGQDDIHPGAAELCNGADDDCDGAVDEEAADPGIWYADADGDGYGDPAVTAAACAAPSGYVADATDCDDTAAAVHPGAAETWYDGRDQDCDGASDYDQDGDAFPPVAWGGNDCDDTDPGLTPFDADGDGFSTCAGDCDDGDGGDFPGASADHVGIAMTCLGRGRFTMGSPADEVGRDDDETEHAVTLTGAFWLGLTEVTQAEFYAELGYDSSAYAGCDACPVTDITWHEAAAFANALTDAADRCYTCTGVGESVVCDLSATWSSPYACPGYRLPTEAEWEYAARAGTSTAFSCGGNLVSGAEAQCSTPVTLDDGTPLGDLAVYCVNDAGHTEAVGERAPNPWGLYDVHGNVWEWCHDWYHGEYGGAATDPWGERAADDYRVIRGGSWNYPARHLRVAARHRDEPGNRTSAQGLRLARSIEP